MNVKVLNTWHAALDDASRNSTIEGLRLSIINALEAMAPEFDDDNTSFYILSIVIYMKLTKKTQQ